MAPYDFQSEKTYYYSSINELMVKDVRAECHVHKMNQSQDAMPKFSLKQQTHRLFIIAACVHQQSMDPFVVIQ